MSVNPKAQIPLLFGGQSVKIEDLQKSVIPLVKFHRTINLLDETTNITTGTAKYTLPNPGDETWTDVVSFLSTAGTVTGSTVDIKVGGTSIFNGTSLLKTDATENSSTTSASPFVFAASASSVDVDEGDIVTIDITAIPTAGKGLKVIITGFNRTA